MADGPKRLPPRRERHKDVSFEVPGTWVDCTLVSFGSAGEPFDGHSSLNVIHSRRTLLDGESLREHASRMLLGLDNQFADFELLESSETHLAGEPALRYRFTFTGAVAKLEQTVVMAERQSGDLRIAATFTLTCFEEVAALAKPYFAAILQSIRFEPDSRGAADAAPGASASSPMIPPRDKPDAHDWLPSFPMPGSMRETSKKPR